MKDSIVDAFAGATSGVFSRTVVDAFAGATAGVFARTVVAPIDRIKLLIQLSGSQKEVLYKY